GWGRHGIRLNAIAPGPFPTEGAWSRLMPTEDLQRKFLARVPVGRVGEHTELADLATYLISDGSAYVNGALYYIDGGESDYASGEFKTLSEMSEEDWDALASRRGLGGGSRSEPLEFGAARQAHAEDVRGVLVRDFHGVHAAAELEQLVDGDRLPHPVGALEDGRERAARPARLEARRPLVQDTDGDGPPPYLAAKADGHVLAHHGAPRRLGDVVHLVEEYRRLGGHPKVPTTQLADYEEHGG